MSSMYSKSISLPKVTLCAVGSKRFEEQQQRALDFSSKDIEFGAIKNIIVDLTPINGEESVDEWNYFIIYRLHHYIDTDFVLLIHQDGYVVHPESWDNEWLKYDYIGAPWPMPQDDFSYRDKKGEIIRVGNSVSLRSKRLLKVPDMTHMIWQPFHGYYNEDGFICVNMRHQFTRYGCNFAPIEVAKWFSREHELPENQDVDKPFCFHKGYGRNSVYENFEV